MRRIVLGALIALVGACSPAGGGVDTPTTQSRLVSLPENPCELLTIELVSKITGLEVIEARRKPGIGKSLRAEREAREPSPGPICSYETKSDFGAISVIVPPRTERTEATYLDLRDGYFSTYPGSGRPVPGLGADAWISGGTTLSVLTQDGYFVVTTQMWQERSAELVIKLARAALARL
jgi:hypothetical protein